MKIGSDEWMLMMDVKDDVDRNEACWDDPLGLLGKDIGYDQFVDWLSIADDEQDKGLASLKATHEKLIKYGHTQHAKIVELKINRINDITK